MGPKLAGGTLWPSAPASITEAPTHSLCLLQWWRCWGQGGEGTSFGANFLSLRAPCCLETPTLRGSWRPSGRHLIKQKDCPDSLGGATDKSVSKSKTGSRFSAAAASVEKID